MCISLIIFLRVFVNIPGNSRLLVEEEKFRKSGKKKYETLAEKMLQLYSRLNALTAGGVNGESSMYYCLPIVVLWL